MNGTVVDAATHVASQGMTHDPLILGLAWVVGIVTLLIAIGKPLRDYVRGEKRATGEDKVEDAKTSAETTLYNHLSEQIKQYREISDKAYTERNALVERVARLEEKTSVLEETKAILDRLKAKLEEKDRKLEEKDAEIRRLIDQASEERKKFLQILQSKDGEIAKRDERITSLEQRQRELEVRLAKDELSCPVFPCPFHSANVSVSDQGVPINPVPEASFEEGKT